MKPKKALDNLRFLQEQGIKVPGALLNLVETEVRQKEGVVQVWECKKCGYKLEQFVKIDSASHVCKKAKTRESILLSLSWEQSRT